MPKSPMGGPGGPGASPMVSPGAGAGNKAAAMQSVKAAVGTITLASMAYPPGSKEATHLYNAIRELNKVAGSAQGENMVPAGIASMAQAASKGPMSAAPPPGIKPNSTPPAGMEVPGASMEESAP